MAYIELTEKNFDETVENSTTLVIDFWAPWCGPCLQFGPTFEKVAEQHPEVTFAKINTEEQQGLAGHFQIQSIPTLMVIKEKIMIFKQAGAPDEAGFSNLVQQVKDLDMDEVRAEIEAQQSEAQ
jgi:thioredoxin 1